MTSRSIASNQQSENMNSNSSLQYTLCSSLTSQCFQDPPQSPILTRRYGNLLLVQIWCPQLCISFSPYWGNWPPLPSQRYYTIFCQAKPIKKIKSVNSHGRGSIKTRENRFHVPWLEMKEEELIHRGQHRKTFLQDLREIIFHSLQGSKAPQFILQSSQWLPSYVQRKEEGKMIFKTGKSHTRSPHGVHTKWGQKVG